MTWDKSVFQQRRAGVLLHPRSLPATAQGNRLHRWFDFMHQSGLSVWQILPLGVPHADGSPYQTQSVFAVDPLLFPEVAEMYGSVDLSSDEFSLFCQQQEHWLEDFALYMVLKRLYLGRPWYTWLAPHRDRETGAMEKIRKQYKDELIAVKWQQHKLLDFWHEMHMQAESQGIIIFGDLPIFVAHDSADVWAHREMFLLDDEGQPVYIAGVPPDYFSTTGQRWGNPHYNWQAMQADGFSWWKARIKYLMEWVDMFRIDHFRGLEAVWMIEAKNDNAVDGHWQQTPGDELLSMIEKDIGPVPMVAEDLGIITDEVRKLKQKHKLPGMAVLQFGFDDFDDNPHKPHNITMNTVAYTGTHDNNTLLGWYLSLSVQQQQHVRHSIGISPQDDIVWSMIESSMFSRACLSVIPMQDFLELGEDARLNTPGTMEGNWNWMLSMESLDNDLQLRIHDLLNESGRLANE